MSTTRDSIIDQMTTECPSLVSVVGIADVQAFLDSQVSMGKTPLSGVHRVGRTASPNKYGANEVAQDLVDTWGTILVLSHANDAGGAKVSNACEEIEDEIGAGLVGFTPTGTLRAMVYARQAGRLLRWTNSHYFYECYFNSFTCVRTD